MRIPLDYYRILGLPLAASYEQLRQAYDDRIVQLPRREYSQAAITSRKQLIEEAYVVLSDPKERKAYDQVYLAHAYGSDGVDATVAVENRVQGNNHSTDGHNLTIEISQNELVGALLILQELGEYELVLKLGRPYIVSKNGATGVNPNYGTLNEEALERPDVVLTVALACLELGREQWQQGHYENAAISLETGEELLSREGLFPRVRDEIIADLYRLRPYRILELLALPEDRTAERSQGLTLLQEVLDQRGGIDGAGNDQSGLSTDDFLRFIQQLRNYLTVAEQHELFEEQSKRPSAVTTYLAVYTLIARGFAERQPALIRQAKQLLNRLSKRQDVHLEQSLCALLLGQTEIATRTLELSQEYEALVFIREHSQGSPDLLPGLCLYGERWLQNEVFPHFRDLNGQQVSLKEYFANPQVQAYLEALPMEVQTTHEPSNQPFPYPPTAYPDYPNHTTAAPQQPYQPAPAEKRPEYPNISPPNFPKSSTSSPGRSQPQAPMSGYSTPEPTRRRPSSYSSGNSKTPSPQPPPIPRRRRQRTQANTSRRTLDNRHHFPPRQRSMTRRTQSQIRLAGLVLVSLAGFLIFLTIVGWFRDLFFSPSSTDQQLAIELNQPVVPIPDPNSKQESSTGSLTQDAAKEVIDTWLSTKAAALGPNHEIDRLNQILVSPALSQWRLITQQLKTDNRYRKYQHTVKVESLGSNPTDNNHATVEASVTEVTDYYENAQMKKTEKEQLRVKYDLVRAQDAWRIKNMSVITVSGVPK